MWDASFVMSRNVTHCDKDVKPDHAACRHYGQATGPTGGYTVAMALRIKALREARGWTQEHLADISRMSRSQLAMIERETRPANTLRLKAIAAAFGVAPDELFETTDSDRRLMRIARRLSDEDRDALVRVAESMAAKAANVDQD